MTEHDAMTCEWEDCPDCEEVFAFEHSQRTCEECGRTVFGADGGWYHKPGCSKGKK